MTISLKELGAIILWDVEHQKICNPRKHAMTSSRAPHHAYQGNRKEN